MHSTYELVIDDDAGMTTVIPFGQPEVSIGRKVGNSILLTERNISRHHARLLRAGDKVGIEDLGSYTGVLVNGQRISGRALLHAGDRVQIGDYRLALRQVAVAAQRVEVVPVQANLPPPAQAHAPLVRADRTAAPAAEIGSPSAAALPSGWSLGVSPRRVWVTTVLVTMAILWGLMSLRPTAVPKVQKKPAARLSMTRDVVRPRKEVSPVTTVAAPDAQRTVGQDQLPPPKEAKKEISPGIKRRKKIEHPTQYEISPTVTERPAAAALLSQEQTAKLLDQAQTHYINGDFAEAIRIARELKTSQGAAMTRAWRILGAASCKLGNFDLIAEAYRHVDVTSRQYMLYVCQQSGVTLTSGHFVRAN